MPYLSVSTWSLHRHLGPMQMIKWDHIKHTHITEIVQQPSLTELIDLPAMLSDKGFHAMEVCHFHFPRTDDEYLSALKEACRKAEFQFYTLLLDYGDFSSPDPVRREADMALAKQWIEIASKVGAKHIRFVGGEGDPKDSEALKRSVSCLLMLSEYAEEHHVLAITENYQSLLSTAENCLQYVKKSNGRIKLIADFGNFTGHEKYDELANILSQSVSIHAKPQFDHQGLPDGNELNKCLALLQNIDFHGAISIIYDGPGNMWDGIERVKKLIMPVF